MTLWIFCSNYLNLLNKKGTAYQKKKTMLVLFYIYVFVNGIGYIHHLKGKKNESENLKFITLEKKLYY